MKTTIDKLRKLHACSDAVEWAETQADPQTAWDGCERADWMLWLCGKLSGEPGSEARKPLVLAACECARLALKHVPKDEHRPLKAIETAEAWARNEGPTLDDVRYAAAAADAAYAAYAAYADAADAAAAYAAYAAYADAADADAAARRVVLNQCADIVRKHYPKAPKL